MSIILKALKKVQNQESADASMAGSPGSDMDQVASAKASPGQSQPETGDSSSRFGAGPKALLGLVLLLGVFSTGWFASRILDNMRSGAADNQASSQANVEQIARSVEPAKPPIESAPMAVAPAKTPPAPVETAPPMEAAPAPTPKVIAASVAKPTPAPPPPPPKPKVKPVAPKPSPVKEAKPVREGRPELKINAIAWRAKEPKAIVNMQRVYAGDTIEGATVLAIQRKSVLFEYDGETFEVRF